jgi:hypothetical protein
MIQQRDGRRINFARSWQFARQQLASVSAERDALLRELADMRQQRDAAIDALRELGAARAAVVQAEHELRELYRERAIQRAQNAARDPARPLQ